MNIKQIKRVFYLYSNVYFSTIRVETAGADVPYDVHRQMTYCGEEYSSGDMFRNIFSEYELIDFKTDGENAYVKLNGRITNKNKEKPLLFLFRTDSHIFFLDGKKVFAL